MSDEKSFAETPVIKSLIGLLQGDSFERVNAVPITGAPIVRIDELVIYRNKAELPDVVEKPSLEIKAIDRTID